MDLSRIRELLKIVAESDVAEVEIEEDDVKIVVRKNAASVMVQQPSFPFPMYPMPGYGMPPAAAPSPAPAPQAPVVPADDAASASDDEQGLVRAPIVGTFYARPSPEDEPYVSVGDRVEVGDVLCIIEAMKLMNEIESEVAGTVKKVLVQDGNPVEFDQPLFVIQP